MTINITCTRSRLWKNVYSKHKHNNMPCFKDKHYWEKLDSGSYELTKTIRVSYDGLCIADDYSWHTLGLSYSASDWQGIPAKVSEEDTYTKLVNDIAKYVLHLTNNYLN